MKPTSAERGARLQAAILCGTITFLATAAIGWIGGLGPMRLVARAALSGLAVGGAAALLASLAVRSLLESLRPSAAAGTGGAAGTTAPANPRAAKPQPAEERPAFERKPPSTAPPAPGSQEPQGGAGPPTPGARGVQA